MTTNKIGKESKLHNRSSINDNFTIISRKAVQDKSLSWKARGVLFYILSLPPGWILRQSDLVTRSDKDGREATASAINELIKAGYIIKTEMREAGKFIGVHYEVFDFPVTDSPQTGFPFTVKPTTDNQPLYNIYNNNIYNTQRNKEDIYPPISPQGGTGSPDGSPLSLTQDSKELNPEESAKVSPKHSTLNDHNPTPPVAPPPPPLLEQYMDIIRGVFSRPRLKPTKFLSARIKEGMTLDDCRLLCEYLTARWGNDPKMKQYLDTTTPFRKEKHPGYMALAQEWLDSRASREKARETAERLATEWKSIPGIQIDTRAVAERLEAIPDYDTAHLVSEARAYIRYCNTAHRIVKNPENWLASMSFSPTRPVGYDHEAYMAMGHEQKATERKRLTDAGYRPVQAQDGTFCGFFKKQDIESLFPGGSWFNAPAETYRKP